jgi:hypothetical protein
MLEQQEFFKEVEVNGKTEKAFFDPRPDLGDGVESLAWADLLATSFRFNKNLFYVLHGFRCQGTRLIRNDNGAWVMRPEIGPNSWESQEAYDQWKKKYLEPLRREVILVLKKLP